MEAQLRRLSHEQLVELAMAQANETPQGRLVAARHIYHHHPLPNWVLSQVMLSPDVLTKIFQSLHVADVSAALVCRTWSSCWASTLVERRILHPAPPLPTLDGSLDCSHDMVALNNERLLVGSSDFSDDADTGLLFVLDQRMVQVVPREADPVLHIRTSPSYYNFAATADSLYASAAKHIYRLSLDTNLDVLAMSAPLHCEGVAVAAGLVFTVTDVRQDNPIHALDATTLAPRFTFGDVIRYQTFGLTTSDTELYVCEDHSHNVHVFSFTGQHIRTITGKCCCPDKILFFSGRLYLTEYYFNKEHYDEDDKDNDDDDAASFPSPNPPPPDEIQKVMGRRILVLTPEGEVLQTYMATTDPMERVVTMAVWHEQLVVAITTLGQHSGVYWELGEPAGCRFLALQGI